jgi:D-alanine-D-alanine ligase
MSKTRVAVLRGGPSDEYDVSLRTGNAVLRAIDTSRYEPLDITITKGGEWLHHGRTYFPEHLVCAVDVVFLALHGSYGEDGRIQRLLDRYGVPYTGSGAYASSLAMNKGLAKEHVQGGSFKLPQHLRIERSGGKNGRQYAGDIRERFGPEYIVKPIASGSSVGIRLVRNTLDLGTIIDEAFELHDELLVEEYIHGREVTCGVVERFRNHELYALPPIDIIPPPSASFFNHEVKYDGSTQEICPSNLPMQVKAQVEAASREIHQILNLRQYSRSDFIVGKDGLYFLEVNTLPGLTSESLLPKALTAVGATYESFIHHLIEDAVRGYVS